MTESDQNEYEAIRLGSPQRLMEAARARCGLTTRSVELVEGVRRLLPTDPSASEVGRLRHLHARLESMIDRLGITRSRRAAGTTTPTTCGTDASDQYFLVERDDGQDPIVLMLEALVVSTANLIDERLRRGTTLSDLESYYLVYPLLAAASLVEDALRPTA